MTSQRHMYENDVQKVTLQARYLGPYFVSNASVRAEVTRIVEATWSAYRAYGSFRKAKRASLQMKKLLFNAVLVGTMYSGLTAFVRGDSEYKLMDTALHMMARNMLCV